MSSKEGLCLWCGRWTDSRSEDGLADCDRPECIAKRDYDSEEADPLNPGVVLERKNVPGPAGARKEGTLWERVE